MTIKIKIIKSKYVNGTLKTNRDFRKRTCKDFTGFKYEIIIRQSIHLEKMY